MGSTTTDIIPIGRFEELKGLTDLDRLQQGYLIYTGMLRTSVPCLIRSVLLDGVPTPVSSEYFACSGDVHRVLGHIREREYTSDPPDGGKRDVAAALRRLARVVCADLDEIGESGARTIAETFWNVQKDLIFSGIDNVCRKNGTNEVIFAGIGSGLIARKIWRDQSFRSTWPGCRCTTGICGPGGSDTGRYTLSILLLAVSLGLTAAALVFHWPFFFLFLAIPFVPFLKQRPVWKCPACGWVTSGSERFCPCDGTRLEGPGSEHREGNN